MPRYIIERNVGKEMTREQLDAASLRSIEAAAHIPGLVWIRSYVSEVEGKLYCEYDAPDPQALHAHAERAKIPIDKVSLVSLEISPAMFR